MQLLALALYARDGRRRDVEFLPGRLNVVTGESKTGKSALLTITEFCLGRDSYLVPVGPIAKHVVWFGSLWQLSDDPEGPRAFVGRPAPPDGKKSTQRAMLEFGGKNLQLPDKDQLSENADSDSVRRQLGRRIGITENIVESRGPGMNQTPFEAHLGHATWLCLQDQDEIASRHLLFHRQGEGSVAEHLKDTIPYFLGAVPADAAAKKTALRDAYRALRRAESRLSVAEQESESADDTLRGLVSEAHAVGLVDDANLTERENIVAALQSTRLQARQAGQASGPNAEFDRRPTQSLDDPVQAQNRRREISRRRDDLRIDLAAVMDSRALLLDRRDAEQDFMEAVALHTGRMTSLELLPSNRDDGEGGQEACPICGSELDHPDPVVSDLSERLVQLRDQLTALDAAPESRRRAITNLEADADRLRGQLSAIQTALEALDAADQVALLEQNAAATRNYTRGRIDAYLSILETGAAPSLKRLRDTVAQATLLVTRLENEVDSDSQREELLSRLNIVGRMMTEYAEKLGLEHVENGVRLDLSALNVVTDTSTGPLPLSRIGSAANWIGYHLVTHLALHRFFVENDRPVPRFLMVDQPTQAYYPSDTAKNVGQVPDADRAAVLALFTVMRDVVRELAPKMQIIVSDHANLGETWFQEAVQHEWRDGVKLVPLDWISDEQRLA